ncbi:hypothetical protein [Natrinema sp. H-ect4]|uniref:hypothetical protein n=1 Tax=Natrinema sp. H-ect4 TaxID=3242699 RepID=UPI0035A8E2AA
MDDGLDHDLSELRNAEYGTGTVWERSANGQKLLTVPSGCSIEPGDDVVIIPESLFKEIREVLDI